MIIPNWASFGVTDTGSLPIIIGQFADHGVVTNHQINAG